MGRKEKLIKILTDLSSSFEKSKLLEYMDFNPKSFVFKPERSNLDGKVIYNALASYDLEKDKFYLLKELFNPGPLNNEQKIQNTESQKALIMHEEVHRAVIKSGFLDKYKNDSVISSTFYLDKYHSLPFVLAALKFNGRISNYLYSDNELVDFTSNFNSFEKFIKYLKSQSPFNIEKNLYLLDLTNLKESAKYMVASLNSLGFNFRDGTMFAVNPKEVLVYFKNDFYIAMLNDSKSSISINYRKIKL
jgi:hypothetical protein